MIMNLQDTTEMLVTQTIGVSTVFKYDTYKNDKNLMMYSQNQVFEFETQLLLVGMFFFFFAQFICFHFILIHLNV